MQMKWGEKHYIGCCPGQTIELGIISNIVDPKDENAVQPPIYSEMYDNVLALSYEKPMYTKFYEVAFLILEIEGGKLLYNLDVLREVKGPTLTKIVKEQADAVSDEVKAFARVSTGTMLKELAKSERDQVRALVALNPKTNSTILTQLAKEENRSVSFNIIRNPNANVTTIKSILDKFPDLISLYLKFVDVIPVSVLEYLYDMNFDSDDIRKTTLIEKLCAVDNVSPELINKLVSDPDVPASEKIGMLTNTSVDIEAIEGFIDQVDSVYTNKDILVNIVKREDCTAKVIDSVVSKFLSNFLLDDIPELIKHKNTSSETLKRVAMIHKEPVVKEIVTHPNVTKEAIDIVLSGGEHALKMFVKNIAPPNVLEWIDD